jgi:putative intracellular protease/amidase
METPQVLILSTSHKSFGETGRKTGVWLEEVAVPYYLFKEAGFVPVLASPLGGIVPLDPKSESIIVANGITKRFLKDPEALAWLHHSVNLNTVSAADYDLVYIAGGHGAMYDFPGNAELNLLLQDFYVQDKLIGIVCHGSAAMLDMKSNTGTSLLAQREITAFSNSEEKVWGLTAVVPFSLETALIALGVIYTKYSDFEGYTVVDGNFISGQNANSSKEVVRKMLLALKAKPKRMPVLSN